MTADSSAECDLPRVSVVVPTLNRAGFLRGTIDSILAQDYPNLECVVVDGGSTDETREILASYGPRIRWISEPDAGPFDAVNKGWAMTTGEVCAWLSADDWYEPGAIATAMRAFSDHPEVDVVHGLCATVGPGGKLIRLWGSNPWHYVENVLSCACTIEQPAAFIRRRMIDRVGGVHDIPVLDFDLWLRVSAEGGRFLALPDHLANAHDHAGRISNNPAVMVPAVVEAIRRALAHPRADPRIKANGSRALSSAYMHGFYFAGQRRWDWVAYCAAQAMRACPSNSWQVLRQLLGAIENQPGTPPLLQQTAWASRRTWSLLHTDFAKGAMTALAVLAAWRAWRR